MKLLGIDYGLRKIGLARAEVGLVEPLVVLENSSDLVKRIAAICQKEEIERIVIGMTDGKLAERIEGFAKKLSLFTRLPVDFQDETLTTKEAIGKMIQAGRGQKARRKFEDAVAAACILQNYLEERP